MSSFSESPDSAASSDDELMRGVSAGDGAAFEALVQRYVPRLSDYAWRMLREREAARDVAQETLLRLWNTAPRWQHRQGTKTWLYRVAYRLCIDRLRRRPEEALSEDFPMAEDETSPLEAYAQEERRAVVEAAIASLPERQRSVLALVYYNGLGNQEAAAVMNTSVEAVESLLARARRTLRQVLAHLQRPGA